MDINPYLEIFAKRKNFIEVVYEVNKDRLVCFVDGQEYQIGMWSIIEQKYKGAFVYTLPWELVEEINYDDLWE